MIMIAQVGQESSKESPRYSKGAKKMNMIAQDKPDIAQDRLKMSNNDGQDSQKESKKAKLEPT
eukprot:2449596-Karenia_brevis.AAC.1